MLLGVFVALTIVLASTTVYESGNRTTVTSTSISMSISTKTLTPSTSVLLGNTALVLNSSNHLGLSLQAEPGLNGNYTFTVRVSNLLDSVNNVSGADVWAKWARTQDSLDPCGPIPFPYSDAAVEFAVVQGHYGENNYSMSEALPLYDTRVPHTCGGLLVPIVDPGKLYSYAFQPLNDTFLFPSGSSVYFHGAASVTVTTSGYWTGGRNGAAAVFVPFPPGVYTLIGADEWGDVVFLQAFLE